MKRLAILLLVFGALASGEARAAHDGSQSVIGRFNHDRAEDVFLRTERGLISFDGRDGSVLWKQPASWMEYDAVQLFGDRRTEIFGSSDRIVYDEDCDHGGTTTVTLEVRAPGTGSILWQRELSGQKTGPGRCNHEPGWPRLMGDANEDGIRDVFVALDDPPGARLFSGLDGREIGSILACGCDWMEPIADVDGDGSVDLMTVDGLIDGPGISGLASTITARSVDGTIHWEQTLQGGLLDVIAATRLDNSPGTDLILRAFTHAGIESPYRLYAIDGATGSILWDRASHHKVAVAGDVDRDGFKDVLVVSELERTPGGESSVSGIAALSGTSGEVIWQRTIRRRPDDGDREWTERCCEEARFGRDRVKDWILLGAYWVEAGLQEAPVPVRRTAINGATGKILWRTPTATGEPGVLVGDIDGRRGQDFLRVRASTADGRCRIRVRAVSGLDLTRIWRKVVDWPVEDCRAYVDTSADLDADGLHEAVIAVYKPEFDRRGSLLALDRDGIMWTA